MRKAAILALCLFTAAGLAGCGDFAPPADTQAVPAASQQIPAEREATLRLYLPDEDGMHVSLRESKVPAKQMTLKNALVQLIRLDREQKYPLLPTGLTINFRAAERPLRRHHRAESFHRHVRQYGDGIPQCPTGRFPNGRPACHRIHRPLRYDTAFQEKRRHDPHGKEISTAKGPRLYGAGLFTHSISLPSPILFPAGF